MAEIRKGSRVRVKRGWHEEGKVGKALGRPVFVQQEWLPVLWDDEEDPEFFKLAGVETYTAETLRKERLAARPRAATEDK